MKMVDQEFFLENDEFSDCVRAATASILELDRDDVPHFVRDNPGHEWYEHWEAWLLARGHRAVMLHGPWDAPPRLLGHYLASGMTPRGTKHMVVMRDGVLAHDPHPSREGLNEIQAVWLIKDV